MNQFIPEILSFLTQWPAFHILNTDMRMAKVVLAAKSGIILSLAKEKTDQEMSGAMKTLIDSMISMFNTLSARTIQLAKEVLERKKAEPS